MTALDPQAVVEVVSTLGGSASTQAVLARLFARFDAAPERDVYAAIRSATATGLLRFDADMHLALPEAAPAPEPGVLTPTTPEPDVRELQRIARRAVLAWEAPGLPGKSCTEQAQQDAAYLLEAIQVLITKLARCRGRKGPSWSEWAGEALAPRKLVDSDGEVVREPRPGSWVFAGYSEGFVGARVEARGDALFVVAAGEEAQLGRSPTTGAWERVGDWRPVGEGR